MDDNVVVPRPSEGLSVVSSLSEVSEQIAIAEHIPTEHETGANAVFQAKTLRVLMLAAIHNAKCKL